ncbi:MAG: tetratricopeptide repeat protein [Candidatus Omnitrophota bacterium]
MRRVSISLSLILLACLLSATKIQAKDRAIGKTLSHYILGGIYERLDDLDEAVGHYKAAVKADPNSPQLHLNLAVALIKQNNLKKAIFELKRAIKLDSSAGLEQSESISIEAHTVLALIYSLQGKLDQAAHEYELALEGALAVYPQNIRIHKSLGQVYLQQNRLSDAEKTYRFILDVAPSDFEAHFYLGNIYELQGRRPEAIDEFKAALEFNSDYPDALNSLAYVYADESINLEDAEQMIKKALSYEPNNGAYIDSLGWVYFRQGKYQEAIQKLEEAVQFLSDPLIYEHLGDAYLKGNNLIKAKENWQRSLDIDSETNPQVKEKLEKYK